MVRLRLAPLSATLVFQMSALSRIGVAIDEDLLEKFDALIASRGYTNRSEAFRDLIRAELVDEARERHAEVPITLTAHLGSSAALVPVLAELAENAS